MLNLTKGRLLSVVCALIFAPTLFAQSSVKLSELMASNLSLVDTNGAITDWVELVNESSAAVDLTGVSFSDDEFNPTEWSFPPGSSIKANGYLVVAFDPNRAPSEVVEPVLNTGFGIKATGMNLFLFGVNFGDLLDSVSFGNQVADLSIGKISGVWKLCQPTRGAANVAKLLGPNINLKINEWMANPPAGDDDWFELYNPNDEPASLSGLYLTDTLTIKDMFPIAPLSFIGSGLQAYAKYVADGNVEKGPEHVSFSLKAGGEAIGLFDSTGQQIDTVTFGAQAPGVSQGRLLDGSTNITTFPGTASPERANYKDIPTIVVNELLAHTDPPLEDAVEFYNTSETATNVGGWFLSNKESELKKYRIPDNTIIPGKGYLVIYEKDFNNTNVALSAFTFNSAHGDQVYLAQADGTNLTGFRVSQEFESSENGVSFGRVYTIVTNDFKFVAMESLTFGVNNPATTNDFVLGKGATNSPPRVGPVVFNEVNFNPLSLDGFDNREDEFIELYNITAEDVPLYDPAHPENHWRLQNGVTFVFPGGRSIPAFGYALIVSFDPDFDTVTAANFRARWGVPNNVDLYGPFGGDLNNDGDSLELYKPDPPQTFPHPDAGYVPYIRVDKVNYTDRAPWPSTADGTGFSLQRRNPRTFGNDPINWDGAKPTPGVANDPSLVDTDVDGMPDQWEIDNRFNKDDPSDATLDADGDGMSNRDEFLAGTDPHNAASKLVILSVVPARSEVDPLQITFAAAKDKTYTVQYRSSLGISSEWQTLTTVDPDPSARDVIVSDPEAFVKTDRYYRIIVR